VTEREARVTKVCRKGRRNETAARPDNFIKEGEDQFRKGVVRSFSELSVYNLKCECRAYLMGQSKPGTLPNESLVSKDSQT